MHRKASCHTYWSGEVRSTVPMVRLRTAESVSSTKSTVNGKLDSSNNVSNCERSRADKVAVARSKSENGFAVPFVREPKT